MLSLIFRRVTQTTGIVLSAALLIWGVFYYYGRDLPSEETLLNYYPPITTKIYSAEKELIEEYAVEHRVILPFNKIPMIVKGAFIVAEDKDFYYHAGISLPSLLRAILENTIRRSWKRKPAGGSTITQQIAKNLLVGGARKISRKIREAIMAFRIEATIPKDKILEIYINQLYLGKGCYGVLEACDYYFDKPIDMLEAHEAAFLASIPSAPSAYINMTESSKLLLKRNSILRQMYERGYITSQQLKTAISKPIEINLKKRKISAPYFSDEIFRIFTQHIPKESFARGGYIITTTMKKTFQRCIDLAMENGLIEYTKSKPWRGPVGHAGGDATMDLSRITKKLPTTVNKITACVVRKVNKTTLQCEDKDKKPITVKLRDRFYADAQFRPGDIILCRYMPHEKIHELYQTPEVTGAMVAMDLSNGNVLGMTGGYSFDISTFNCATQAMRQPGSTIKPFVYAAALESGMDETDIIYDKPVTITLADGSKYTPHNYGGRCYGEIPLRDGLIYSRNLATIDVAMRVGMDDISHILKTTELIKSQIPISAVLGSVETTLLRLVTAFSAFFNGGIMVYPRFMTETTQQSGSALQGETKHYFQKVMVKRVLSRETADIMKRILHDAVMYGTANALHGLESELGISIFGKTGTTNEFKDAWFIGCVKDGTRSYILGVFVGYRTPRKLGDRCSGARIALPIFANFVKEFYSKNQDR
ncbi:MAG: transglycosylase domain-containing protein [Holosporales bacterium]|jgi:penicillin-binding protein 1A|nr:transglycosylase domain-containing protein [Holosporales bacterium]